MTRDICTFAVLCSVKIAVKILFTCILGPAVISTVCKNSSKFLSRILYLSSYVFLQQRRSFTRSEIAIRLSRDILMFLAAT